MASQVRTAGVLILAMAAMAATGGTPADARVAPPPEPMHVVFLGPTSGPGAAAAAEFVEGLRFSAGRTPPAGARAISILPVDDGDAAASATKAFDAAVKQKAHAVVTSAKGVVLDAVVARARAGKIPLLCVGSAGVEPSTSAASPVLSFAPSAVEEAMALANLLALRATKPAIGIVGVTRRPGIVAEDSVPGRALADAFARNLGRGLEVAGSVFVAPRGAPVAADLDALRKAGCDRLVLLGEPDLLDAAATALESLAWKVPTLAGAAALSTAAVSPGEGRWTGLTLLSALPLRVAKAPDALAQAHERAHPGRPVHPRTALGWLAGDLLREAAEKVPGLGGPDLVAALRAVAYGSDEANMPVLDDLGRAALWRFHPWQVGERGPEPCNPGFQPLPNAGPIPGMRGPERTAPPTPGKIVWMTFGDEHSPEPRSIDQDLVALGLRSGGASPEADAMVLDELLARAAGKLNRMFLKEYDGTVHPGVSFDISFTAEKPAEPGKGRLWTMLIAGTGPSGRHGATHENGTGLVVLHSGWIVKNVTGLSKGRLFPPLSADDLRYLKGEYAWGESMEGNNRADQIRGLLDGLAGAFALRSAKELGLMAGLSLENGQDIRSIMNVKGGEGLHENNVHWTPKETKLLEKVPGRVKK